MNKSTLSVFIIGMIAGALLLYLIQYMRSNSDEEQLRQQMIGVLSNKLTSLDKKTDVQYIEVTGKKGDVTLHTGMPKDSVKPDEVNLYEIDNTHHEKWGYKLKEEYTADLKIDFENGELTGVSQN